MSLIPVTVDTFVRAETDRMFTDLAASAGGINRWEHRRAPADVDDQLVVRLNRDTLYSFAIVDLDQGATFTLPHAGERYVSVMVVNQDHHIDRIFHEPGEHQLTVDEFGTRYVLLAARTLVDPTDPEDVDEATAIQDQLGLDAPSAEPFVSPDYEPRSFDGVRAALKELARFVPSTERTFGSRDEVDPVRHLIGTAAAWGGLPEHEAIYLNIEPGLPVGSYELRLGDVPVDAFWSVTVYDADGFLVKNDRDAYSVNSVTGERDPDGSITVRFGGCDDGRPNCLPIVDGWNTMVRLYRPRAEILDGSWTVPPITPAT
jgi:hypothetical protein